MSKVNQPGNGHGSLKDIQDLEINENIYWKSPLEDDNFAEYRDNDFIDIIGLDRQEIKLEEFWPRLGPQWDALAITSGNRIILVEAKANIPEIVSPPSNAGPKSKNLIDKSLKMTKIDLGVNNNIDWSGRFYQYTNRLAHLNFLRTVYKKPAYLINIYFLNDESVSGPKTISEWEAALQVLYSYLGLSHHKLSQYMTNIFVDVKKLKH